MSGNQEPYSQKEQATAYETLFGVKIGKCPPRPQVMQEMQGMQGMQGKEEKSPPKSKQ